MSDEKDKVEVKEIEKEVADMEKKLVEKKDQSAVEQMEDLKGVEGDGISFKTKRGKQLKLLPCAIADMPKLYELVSKQQSAKTDDESMKAMLDVFVFALKDTHPEMTKEKCGKELTLGDFPKILSIVMDMNDFFVGMREMAVKQMAIQKIAERGKDAK